MLSGCPSDPCGEMLEGRGSLELQLANQAGIVTMPRSGRPAVPAAMMAAGAEE